MTDNVIRVEEDDFELTEADFEDEFEPKAPTYEVWALGYYHNKITDVEVLLGTFNEPTEAVYYANLVNLNTIKEQTNGKFTQSIDTFSIEVETVVENEDGDLENVGTIFKIELLV